MRSMHAARAMFTAAITACLLAGCNPGTTSSQQHAALPPAPPAPTGVTSGTEHALDSQPAGQSVRGIVDRDKALADLHQVALFYLNDQTDGAQTRDSVLKDVQKSMPKVYDAIQKGDYVLLSGDPGVAPAGASKTIVAYMKAAPTQGGVAAFLDGHVENVKTADEFKGYALLGK